MWTLLSSMIIKTCTRRTCPNSLHAIYRTSLFHRPSNLPKVLLHRIISTRMILPSPAPPCPRSPSPNPSPNLRAIPHASPHTSLPHLQPTLLPPRHSSNHHSRLNPLRHPPTPQYPRKRRPPSPRNPSRQNPCIPNSRNRSHTRHHNLRQVNRR